MSLPVTKSLYFSTGSFTGTTFGGLLEIAPPNTNTTWGWIVGVNNPPLFCEMNWNVEVARTSTQWQSPPTQSIPSQNASGSGAGNGWIAGPYTGEFVGGAWQITQSVKATTNAGGQDGFLVYRLWTCPTGSGEGANLVTSSFISSSSVTNLTTTTVQLTTSVNLPRINLRNEYLFFQTYWALTGAANNNGADVDYVFGSTSGSIKTTGFVTSSARMVTWEQDDLG